MVKMKKKKVMPLLMATFFSLFFTCLAPSVRSQGGPPMLTDDPGTPGNRMWEVNFLSTLERNRSGAMFEAPNVDLNYGLGNHIQLKFEMPWLVMRDGSEGMKGGPGNSMFGVKWRFLDEERYGVDMSAYPQLEFNNPTRSVARGLVDRGMRLFLPVEVMRKVGPVEVNGELGYRFVQYGPDELEYGLAIGRQVTERVELIGEFHGSALRTLGGAELLFNAGSRVRLSKNSLLLFSAGRTVRSAGDKGPQYIAAFGIQFNFASRAFAPWINNKNARNSTTTR
jgi:hypothetical protein